MMDDMVAPIRRPPQRNGVERLVLLIWDVLDVLVSLVRDPLDVLIRMVAGPPKGSSPSSSPRGSSRGSPQGSPRPPGLGMDDTEDLVIITPADHEVLLSFYKQQAPESATVRLSAWYLCRWSQAVNTCLGRTQAQQVSEVLSWHYEKWTKDEKPAADVAAAKAKRHVHDWRATMRADFRAQRGLDPWGEHEGLLDIESERAARRRELGGTYVAALIRIESRPNSSVLVCLLHPWQS